MESRRDGNRSGVVLPDDIRAEVEAARSLQLEAVAAAQRSTRAWRDVARKVAATGIGINDAARLLGVTPRRVRDLLDGPD